MGLPIHESPVLTGGRKTPSGTLASIDDVAATISVRRYVHGLVKVSIYPDSYTRATRQQRVGLMRMMREQDARVQEAKLARINRNYLNDMEKRQERDMQRLDSRSNSQRDSGDIPGWGGLPSKKMFSRNGAIVINEVGQIGEQRYGKSGIFLTGTIPGTGAELNEVVARWSAYLVNRVKQWFRRWFKQDYLLFNVWEFQKRGMLHIHLCVMSHEKTVLEKALKQWKPLWNKLLIELSDSTGVDLFRKNKNVTWRNQLHKTQHDGQWIHTSVARYMAKYLSKGARSKASKSAAHPSQWWGADKRTKAEARAGRLTVKLSSVELGYAKRLVAQLFGERQDLFSDIELHEHDDVPGIVFGGKFFDPIQAQIATLEFFRFLSLVGGDRVEAVFGE